METNHPKIKIETVLRPDAVNLGEFISDMLATCEGPYSARDIAESYLDQNVADHITSDRFNELVKHFTKQVKFYL